MAKKTIIWTVPKHLSLQWHSWGEGAAEEFVVFNPSSGETHCLNLTSVLVLQSLAEHPASAEIVVENIRKSLPAGNDTAILEKIPELLDELDQCGLIVPVLS